MSDWFDFEPVSFEDGDWSFPSVEGYVEGLEAKLDVTSFAPEIRPVSIVDALPDLPSTDFPEGSLAYLKSEGKLYRTDGVEWTAAVSIDDLQGQITETHIADDAISSPKIQALAITALHLASGSVQTHHLTADAVDAGVIAAGAISSTHIAAEGLDAGVITTGSLTLGGLPGMPDILYVYDQDGDVIGQWNEDGLLLTDPDDPLKQVRLRDGILEFSVTGGDSDLSGNGWTTAISGAGIVADSITVGRLPGGHNNIPNSGFEVSAFTQPATKIWTSSADWQSHLVGGNINIDDTGSAGNLQLLSATYA